MIGVDLEVAWREGLGEAGAWIVPCTIVSGGAGGWRR